MRVYMENEFICHLCARDCGINREKYTGRCGETMMVRCSRAALHMWEEPCISGNTGSGAVFFSGCPLRCVFCQNRSIALGGSGYPVTIAELAEIFRNLESQGACNINLVTPTHFVPQIIEAVKTAREENASGRLTVPVVYNTASYERPETIRLLEGTVDIFLPDMKYRDPKIADRYSRAPDYFETAAAAIREMVKISGPPVFDENGLMKRGTIVRHMILPGHTHDSMEIIRYLHETYGDEIYISIMNQYTPMPGIESCDPLLGGRVTRREYDKVVDYAIGIGVEMAFIQDGKTAEESFIPAFDGEGVIKKGSAQYDRLSGKSNCSQ